MSIAATQVYKIVSAPLGTNNYFFQYNGKNYLIDASYDTDKLFQKMQTKNFATIDYILITHAHYDHIAGLHKILQKFPKAQVYIAAAEKSWLCDPEKNLSIWDENLTIDFNFKFNELKNPNCQVLDVSGHSLAGVAFYFPDLKIVFTGDSLFKDAIGRTDLPNSNHQNLINNIHNHLLSLPNNTKVYPGHGLNTKIELEKLNNPFL